MEKKTLFSHYKKMINDIWDEGFRKYTANELNTFVGSHENITGWKRSNNNPYYSTRCYQTQLKHLGCITPIKRGLWQINGPIPEWFGSFHIKGLKGAYNLNSEYADHTCIYWNFLDPKYKINPWKSINPMRVMASIQPLDLNNPADRAQYMNTDLAQNQQRRDELNATLDAVKEQNNQARLEDVIDASTGLYEPNKNTNNTQNMTPKNFTVNKADVEKTCDCYNANFTITAPFGAQFECKAYANRVLTHNNTWEIETPEVELILVSNRKADYVDIRNMIFLMMGNDEGKQWLQSLDKYAMELVAECVKMEESQTTDSTGLYTKKQVDQILGLYTKEQVEQILKAFVDYSRSSVKSEVQDAVEQLDAEDIVELDFDTYNRSISVDFDSRQISANVVDSVDEALTNALNEFDYETVVTK